MSAVAQLTVAALRGPATLTRAVRGAKGASILAGAHLALPGRVCRLGTPVAARHCASAAAGFPFRVLGLQQVAIGGLDKGRLSALWEGVLGVPRVGTYVSERENVDEDILLLGAGPLAVELDLMQPLDPERAPKVHVPPLNHIGLWVDPLDDAVAHLQARGVRFAPGGIRKGASGHDVAFIHPRGSEAEPLCGEGVLLELVQAYAHAGTHILPAPHARPADSLAAHADPSPPVLTSRALPRLARHVRRPPEVVAAFEAQLKTAS